MSKLKSESFAINCKFQTPKLTEQERAEKLKPLLDAGWTMVNGRDAIYKELMFKDFNEVGFGRSLNSSARF
jgi:pterin-4a-carbinolamine dehydratase